MITVADGIRNLILLDFCLVLACFSVVALLPVWLAKQAVVNAQDFALRHSTGFNNWEKLPKCNFLCIVWMPNVGLPCTPNKR
jgi:hypothetical protein